MRVTFPGSRLLPPERRELGVRWKKLSDAEREKYGYDFAKFIDAQKKDLAN